MEEMAWQKDNNLTESASSLGMGNVSLEPAASFYMNIHLSVDMVATAEERAPVDVLMMREWLGTTSGKITEIADGVVTVEVGFVSLFILRI